MKALGLVFATAVLISSASAADFFPLQPGNSWTYRNARTGATLTVDVGSPVVMNQRVYHMLHGYAQRSLPVRLDGRGDLVMIDPESGQERTLTSFIPLQGGWWEAPWRGCTQEGITFDRGTVHDGPAGPFPDVREVSYRVIACADFGVESEQFAGNIGMVRRVDQSIAGPQTWDLVFARVGELRIDALPHAAFSVTALNSGPDNITARLLLETASPLPLTLSFPSAQEFDVALTGEDGRVIWKWSDGQFFATAGHVMKVDRRWEVFIAIPGAVLPPAGNYLLRAWLTTAEPQFAATLPIAIAR